MKYLKLDSVKKWHKRAKGNCIICAKVLAYVSAPYIMVVSLMLAQSQSYY